MYSSLFTSWWGIDWLPRFTIAESYPPSEDGLSPSLLISSCPLSGGPTSSQAKAHLLTPLSGRSRPPPRLRLSKAFPQSAEASNGSLSVGRTRVPAKQAAPGLVCANKQKKVGRRRTTNGWRAVGAPTEREVFIAVSCWRIRPLPNTETQMVWAPAACLRLRARTRRPCGAATTAWSVTGRSSESGTRCCCGPGPGRSPSRTWPKYRLCGRTRRQVKPGGMGGVRWAGPACSPVCLCRRADDEPLLVLQTWAHSGRPRSPCSLWGEAERRPPWCPWPSAPPFPHDHVTPPFRTRSSPLGIRTRTAWPA